MTRGSRRLDRIIKERGLSSEKAAAEISAVAGKVPAYARCTVHGWRHGQMRPELQGRVDIALWSREPLDGGGYGPPTITDDDWLLDNERVSVAAVRKAS